MVRVLGAGQVQVQRQAGSHRCEADGGKNQNRVFQRQIHITPFYAQAGHKPSNRTCWRLMTNPFWWIWAMGSEISVMQRVTPQLVHVKCGWHCFSEQ